MSPQAVRSLALVATLGGAFYAVTGVLQLATPQRAGPLYQPGDALIEGLRALALLLTLAGFVALHLVQAGGYGGPRGVVGFRAAFLGQGAILVASIASLMAGAPALGFLSVLGTLALLVGIALLTVATHNAALLPSWSAYPVGALAAGVFGGVGVVLAGLAWVALGYVMWSRRDASTGGPSRAT